MDIGDILVSQGKLTEQVLQQCRQAIKDTGQALNDYFIENNVVSTEDIARAFAELVAVDYVEKITEKMADPSLLGKIPLKFLRQYVVMPVMREGKISILTANPRNFQPIDELRLLLGEEAGIGVSSPAAIIDAINRFYPLEGTKQMIEELEEEEKGVVEAVEFAEIEEKDILAMATEAPIIKLVNHILVQAVKRDASDIHIEPFEKELRVRYRVDGVMHTVFTPPKRVQAALASRIKIMSNLIFYWILYSHNINFYCIKFI